MKYDRNLKTIDYCSENIAIIIDTRKMIKCK